MKTNSKIIIIYKNKIIRRTYCIIKLKKINSRFINKKYDSFLKQVMFKKKRFQLVNKKSFHNKCRFHTVFLSLEQFLLLKLN